MKIVVIASHPGSLVVFRGEMLKAMVAKGHEVTAVAPGETEHVMEALADYGVRLRHRSLDPRGIDPIQDLATFRALHRVLRETAPDVVLSYTAKPVIYGLLAARLARVPLRVAMISGRGSALAGGSGLKRQALSAAHGFHVRGRASRCARRLLPEPGR